MASDLDFGKTMRGETWRPNTDSFRAASTDGLMLLEDIEQGLL